MKTSHRATAVTSWFASLLLAGVRCAGAELIEVIPQVAVQRPIGEVTASAPDGPLAGHWQKRASFLRGRIYHTAVLTYEGMIVWGGGSEHQFYDDGGIYDPVEDQWRALSRENAPSGRWGHAAVWTGQEMIVWGGRSSFAPDQHKDDGALYDPRADRWRPMSRLNAPTPRSQMAAVWTGEEMIVWGGWGDGGACPATGGSYNPRTDTWTALPAEGEGVPVGRLEPAFVWTGRELIVWSGLMSDGQRSCDTGGRYDPEKRKWRAMSASGAPPSVRGASAVWTGKEMLIWGGSHLDANTLVNVGRRSGARYDPETDTWRPMSIDGAP
jgi:N-acetylneuraminic acid mutarotase